MGLEELQVALMLMERVISWDTEVKKARAEGRKPDIEAFKRADDESIERARLAYEQAVKEGR